MSHFCGYCFVELLLHHGDCLQSQHHRTSVPSTVDRRGWCCIFHHRQGSGGREETPEEATLAWHKIKRDRLNSSHIWLIFFLCWSCWSDCWWCHASLPFHDVDASVDIFIQLLGTFRFHVFHIIVKSFSVYLAFLSPGSTPSQRKQPSSEFGWGFATWWSGWLWIEYHQGEGMTSMTWDLSRSNPA